MRPKSELRKKQNRILSENLKRIRRHAKINQIELAKMAGVSVAVVRSIEQKTQIPRPETLEAIANALDHDASELLGVMSDKPPMSFDLRIVADALRFCADQLEKRV